MILEILGFVLSSFLLAIGIAVKFTSDVYPFGLKKFLNRLALTNWAKRQPEKFNTVAVKVPKSTEDLGLLAPEVERKLEQTKELANDEFDELVIHGIDEKGNTLLGQITRYHGDKSDAVIYLLINDVKYTLIKSGVNASSNEFSCGTFKLELAEPMRIWRLWYNGVLQEESKDGKVRLVHGTLHFLWKALESPTDSSKDINSDLLSTYLSRNGKFGENFSELRRILPNGYSQFGTLYGVLKINDIEIPPLHLHGFRTRRFSSSNQGLLNRLELFGMCGVDGNAFRLEAINDGWIDGNLYYASYRVNPILRVNEAEPSSFLRDQSLPKLFTLNDKTKTFRIEIWPGVTSQKISGGLHISTLKLNMNGKESRGILIRRKFDISPRHDVKDVISLTQTRCLANLSETTEAVPFNSDLCLKVSLVGGKGASLAKLTRIANGNEFQTAKGFCLTTTLFSSILPVDKMREIFSAAETEAELDQACSEVMRLIKSSEGVERIRGITQSFLQEQFTRGNNNVKFAVRSSGILEDAADLSCAGQNETFLGVVRESIAERVLDCWASLFTTQSVLYRKNHGQPAFSTMGVVIQEMVEAHAAGVIFSADPRTGNPFEMIINANFGLGESVVSAACDPDNITLIRSREIKPNKNNNVEWAIGNKTLGEKKSKIEVKLDGRTEEVKLDEAESRNFCLKDVDAVRLGNIVDSIQQNLGDSKPIDVEWAILKDGTIYILQSRNITALDSWSNFEIIHELDSPLRTGFERNTTANTGEVMPGASFPLSISVVTRVLDSAIQRGLNENYGDPIVPYMIRSCSIARQRLLLNIINMLYKNNDKEIGAGQIALDLTIFGHRVISKELHDIGVERFGLQSGLGKMIFLSRAVKGVWKSQYEIQRVEKKYSNYKLDPLEFGGDSKTIYENIIRRIHDLHDISATHCAMSEASGVTQMFAFMTLANAKHVDDWDAPLYEDVSKILAVCSDVESADMPTAMDELATSIISHGQLSEDFTKGTPSNALEWLRSNKTLNSALEKFFERHGHRCISELDLCRKSWRTEPEPFIQLLQSIVKNKVKAKESWKSSAKISKYNNDDELLNDLKTEVTSGSKRFLKFILFYCRNATRNRERTKSLLVRTADQQKQAYTRLACVMKEEHLIPDEKLVAFMTLEEIGLIISGHQSTARILFKALRRLKLFPTLNKEQFPEISVGMIEPINQDIKLELGDSIQATPLSTGKVQAAVKVCLNIEEASELLEPGDILVTIGTDIGWSPFFPLLGGIVTELGGLISHGAVVAREYGLPCIVGATNATKIFKSGEQVLLDAGKGTLTKVKL